MYTVLTLCERTHNRNQSTFQKLAMATNLMKEFHKCLQAENTTEVSDAKCSLLFTWLNLKIQMILITGTLYGTIPVPIAVGLHLVFEQQKQMLIVPGLISDLNTLAKTGHVKDSAACASAHPRTH